MSFTRSSLGPSKLGVFARLTLLLPVLTLHCASDDDDGTAHATAGDTGERGGASAGGESASGGTADDPEYPSGAGGGAASPASGGSADGAADAGGTDGAGVAGGEAGGATSAASDLVELPNAEFAEGEPPATNNAGDLPAISGLMGASATTNGGTTTVRIELDGKPDNPTFVVVIDGDSGYFIATATDTNGDGVYEIEIRVGANVDLSTLRVRIAPIDARGNVGAYQSVEYELVPSGVGEVKVTLSFDEDADLDLHVSEPSGFEVFFGTTSSPTGGELDLDSNANCIIDGKNTENVYWGTDGAPDGTYKVWVTHFDSCGVTRAVNYTVTVYNGPAIDTFRGTFAPGTAGERRLITSFVR